MLLILSLGTLLIKCDYANALQSHSVLLRHEKLIHWKMLNLASERFFNQWNKSSEKRFLQQQQNN
jgi:hypothetical protein